MRQNKTFLLLILTSFLLLPSIFMVQVNAPPATFSDTVWVEEKSSAAESAYASSSGSVEVDQRVASSFQEDSIKTFQGGGRMLQFSSDQDVGSNSASFSRHLMCRDFDLSHNPIDPTTIFRPGDTSAVCLATVSINDTIEFKWYYRSDLNKSWVPCYNWLNNSYFPGVYKPEPFEAWLNISGFWPGYHYPRAYKVDVHLDGSPSPAFSEFFEVTNGGLNSPRMCKDVDVNGNPVNVTSRFTIGNDSKAHHYLRFDKIAYFNNDTGYCHNFTTVWIQPDGNINKTHSGNFTDYKNADATWNYWEYNYTSDDYISIDPSTPVGNWTVKVYLDRYLNNTWKRYGPVATTPFIVGNETVADWTFMAYLDADNNLEEVGIDIFEKMASVGSTSQVNIVAQMDRTPGYDSRYGAWTDCKRFYITKDMEPTFVNSIPWIEGGEKNMGDPATLRDFVNWTISTYPANYYFLTLWNHGAGHVGLCFDNSTYPMDFLSLPELSQALSGLPIKIDVVFLDACSMSMIEVAYQIKDYSSVLVGPEGLGYAKVGVSVAPYNNYLSSLTNNPSMLPNAFASEVVGDYITWCNSIADIPDATMAAIDLTKITHLMAPTDDFALELKEKETPYLSKLLETHEQIISARNNTQGYQGPFQGYAGYYIDLYHFAQLINQSVSDEELRNTADQMMTALEIIIIMEDDKNSPDSHGLSMLFPDENEKYEDFEIWYENTDFTEDSLWDEFVKYHLSGYVLTVKTPYPEILVKIVGKSNETDAYGEIRVFVSPGNYNVTVTTSINITGPGSREAFSQWNDKNMSNPRTLFVDRTLTLEAEYRTQYYLQMGANFGTVNLGSDWYFAGSTLNINASAPDVVDGEQYVWLGWTGTGDGSYSGKDNPATITVNNPINETASWIHEYQLIMDTNFGTTYIIEGNTKYPTTAEWYEVGSTVTIGVDPPDVVDVEQYIWDGWTGAGDGSYSGKENPASITMNGTITESATWRQVYLIVTSVYGAPTVTRDWHEAGRPITVSITSPWPVEPTDTRYLCTGWTGTGSVPTTGNTTSVTFTINASSSITWNWKTQYLLTVHIDPTGISPEPSVSPQGPWYDKGSLVNLTAQKISGRVFEHWTVDGARWDPGVYNITVTMDRPYEATAHYESERAWWEILLSSEMLNLIIAFVGIVFPVLLLGVAWVRTRRRRVVVKDLLDKIDKVYSRFKTNPPKCEEELCRLRNKILEDLTDGKITQETYDLIDKRIEESIEELRKQ